MTSVPPFAVLFLSTPDPDAEHAARAAGAADCLRPGDPLPPGAPQAGVLIDPADVLAGAGLPEAIHAVLAGLRDADAGANGCAVLGRPVTDTLKIVDDAGVLRGTADREHYRWLATPLAGPLAALHQAGAAPGMHGLPGGGPAAVGAVLARLQDLGCRISVVPA